ncbi:dTDP-L-rhamnose 4-epimerase [Tsuneonella dongtanensis]|uniref:dTDP-L-rhamnose 4-epimerase n=1 Tax=Tsuneonella dongtanensis TaxID=692370 RepID=A0A1B2A9X9_9SPHN|nr:NAD-dependent epimerase/dehydratase family protein [Tsuneonella dongtanensis]ANY18956.1 dTDP-L-rhamnose 4-epimerase [Tsuneonella dongtanensis]
MRIAITGGMGFIGQALARNLLRGGHDVLLIDNLSPQIHGDIPRATTPEGASLRRLDIKEIVDDHTLIDGCDAVYHLAAETGTAQSMYRIRHYVSVNELGTGALLEALAKCERRPAKLVLASSRSVYGEGAYIDPREPARIIQPTSRTPEQLAAGNWELLATDGHPLQPVATPENLSFAPGSVYAATKAAQELLIRSAAPALGITPVVLRFQNVFGEGQSLQNPYTGIISIFFNRARQGLPIALFEDGLESRDFVHIDDIVGGLVASLFADVPDEEAINLGAGEPTTVAQLAEALVEASGHAVQTNVTGEYRVGDIRHCYADIDRARRYLGYSPQVSLADGLARFCAWAESQPAFEDRSERAMAELRERKLASAG